MIYRILLTTGILGSAIGSACGISMKDLILAFGYPFESHTITTEDGYLLDIYRIPYGRSNNQSNERIPVLLVPGLLCSSFVWISSGRDDSLPFILSEHGYDVWLGNYRGTIWSRKHVSLNPDKDRLKYWNYSFHEIGYYDLAAFIDHILSVTQKKKLFYVGHSQATTSFIVLTSEKPQYNNKVHLSIALAPIIYLGESSSILAVIIATLWNEIEAFIHRHQFYELLPYNPLIGELGRAFCNDQSPFQNICTVVIYLFVGYSNNQFNKSLIPAITVGFPAGGSIKQLQHYVQIFLSKSFHQYDYGKKFNLEMYGNATPPPYELSRVITPHLIYYGSNDMFSRKKDIDTAVSKLPNVMVNKRLGKFNHLDVLWGKDASELIYKEILEYMKQF